MLGVNVKPRKFLGSVLLLTTLILSSSAILGNQPHRVEGSTSESLPELSFTVYPDGWVFIDGVLNETVYYYSSQPTGYTTLEFGWDRSLEASLRSLYSLSNETVEEYPLNSTSLSFYSKLIGDVLSSKLNATVVVPPAIEEWDPLSSFDLALVSELKAGEVAGNITVLVAGYPASIIDFSGNLTHVKFMGEAVIPFISIQGLEINRSFVVETFNYLVENFTGRGSSSLWSMTSGLVECPSELFSNVTVFHDDYASISFEMQIVGNFTKIASDLLVEVFYPMIYPSYYDPEVEEALEAVMYELLSSAVDRVQEEVAHVTYTYSDRKLVIKESNTVDLSGLKEDLDDVIPLLNFSAIPELDVFVDSLLVETYASVDSAEFSVTYSVVGDAVKEGEIAVELDLVFSGDLNEELSHVVSSIVEYYLASTPLGYPVPWQLEFVNSTMIDVGCLRFSYNLSKSSVLMGWENLKVSPPRTAFNSTHFGLEELFNLTTPDYGEEIRMSISVAAGDNVTHGVSIVRPSSVPDPDSAVEGELMVWENLTLSELQPLVFKVERLIEGSYCAGVIDDPCDVSEESPFIVNATSEAEVTLTVTSVSSPVTIIVKNSSEADVGEPKPRSFLLLGNYIEIICDEEVVMNATIKINYSQEKLDEAGLDINSLQIHYWDPSINEWVEVETHVNAEEHYAWAVVDHFSIWGLFGQVHTPFYMQWWFYAIIAVAIVAFGAVAYLALRRRSVAGQAVSEAPVEAGEE